MAAKCVEGVVQDVADASPPDALLVSVEAVSLFNKAWELVGRLRGRT